MHSEVNEEKIGKYFRRKEFACRGEHCCGHSAPVATELVERLDALREQHVIDVIHGKLPRKRRAVSEARVEERVPKLREDAVQRRAAVGHVEVADDEIRRGRIRGREELLRASRELGPAGIRLGCSRVSR